MTRTVTIVTLAAAAALAGCNSEDHTITGGGPDDPMANQLANAAPIELPPAIAASKTYRCKDNSLVYIDWLSDGSARVKTAREDVGTVIPATEVASLNGDARSATVTYNGKSCRS